MEKIKRSIVQSAILWEVMKSYKILENVVISTQRDNKFSQRENHQELTNPRKFSVFGGFLLSNFSHLLLEVE